MSPYCLFVDGIRYQVLFNIKIRCWGFFKFWGLDIHMSRLIVSYLLAPKSIHLSCGCRNLYGYESSVLTQMRTGWTGLRAFLFECGVPEVPMPRCRCGAGERETAFHVVVRCSLLNRQQRRPSQRIRDEGVAHTPRRRQRPERLRKNQEAGSIALSLTKTTRVPLR